MVNAAFNNVGYSAEVRLNLRLGDRRMVLSQVCPTKVNLQTAGEAVSPTEAELLIEVDGVESSSRIFLTNGIKPTDRWVAFENRE